MPNEVGLILLVLSPTRSTVYYNIENFQVTIWENVAVQQYGFSDIYTETLKYSQNCLCTLKSLNTSTNDVDSAKAEHISNWTNGPKNNAQLTVTSRGGDQPTIQYKCSDSDEILIHSDNSQISRLLTKKQWFSTATPNLRNVVQYLPYFRLKLRSSAITCSIHWERRPWLQTWRQWRSCDMSRDQKGVPFR